MTWGPPINHDDFTSNAEWGGVVGTIVSAGEARIQQVPTELPSLAGVGPTEFSTSTDLVVDPVIINDGNHYYRALGFSWPFRGITRNALMKAYQNVDGQSSAWKTYAFKRLLDKEFRPYYDRMPVGGRKVDDYVYAEFEAEAVRVVREHIHPSLVEESRQAFRAVMESMGVPLRTAEPIQPVVVSEEPPGDATQEASPVSERDDTVQHTWSWGYFLMRCRCIDTPRLEAWQLRLSAAFRDLGHTPRIAVGFVGRTDHPFVIGEVGSTLVLYLNEADEPTQELARRAASDVVQMMMQ